MKKIKTVFILLFTILLCTNATSKVYAHTGDEEINENSEYAIENIATDDGVEFSRL